MWWYSGGLSLIENDKNPDQLQEKSIHFTIHLLFLVHCHSFSETWSASTEQNQPRKQSNAQRIYKWVKSLNCGLARSSTLFFLTLNPEESILTLAFSHFFLGEVWGQTAWREGFCVCHLSDTLTQSHFLQLSVLGVPPHIVYSKYVLWSKVYVSWSWEKKMEFMKWLTKMTRTMKKLLLTFNSDHAVSQRHLRRIS